MVTVQRDPDINISTSLRAYVYGPGDATSRLQQGEFWRATLTPHGPASLRITWGTETLTATGWGPGGEWAELQAEAMAGLLDPGFTFADDSHQRILIGQRACRGHRFGASHTLYHELLPNVLGQRVTATEAFQQWRVLCNKLGEVAPGPDVSLRLPPTPERLLDHPSWWFHPLGIEGKRAEALRTVARYASRIDEWSRLGAAEASAKLLLLPGIGPWTVAVAAGPALGDADTVPVGDFHIPHEVCWGLAGEPRGTDARMLELLEPYRGNRRRAIHYLAAGGPAKPKFGPRQSIQPIHKW